MEVKPAVTEIRYLIDRYYSIQRDRMASNHQAIMLGKSKKENKQLRHLTAQLLVVERGFKPIITKALRAHIMHDWLNDVKGIGPILAATLLSTIDIHKARHASSVWAYAGLDPTRKKEKGVKGNWSEFLKMICWRIGESFIKSNGKYRTVYDSSREFYEKKFPEPQPLLDKDGKPRLSREKKPIMRYTKAHIYAMSKRRAVKLFLSHFWEEWRRREGLPTGVPWSHRTDILSEPYRAETQAE